jgi:hypothetical protein
LSITEATSSLMSDVCSGAMVLQHYFLSFPLMFFSFDVLFYNNFLHSSDGVLDGMIGIRFVQLLDSNCLWTWDMITAIYDSTFTLY